jgi:hypothetical protein
MVMKTKDLRTKVTAKIHHVGQSPAFVTGSSLEEEIFTQQ